MANNVISLFSGNEHFRDQLICYIVDLLMVLCRPINGTLLTYKGYFVDVIKRYLSSLKYLICRPSLLQ